MTLVRRSGFCGDGRAHFRSGLGHVRSGTTSGKDIEAEDYDLSFSRYKVDVFEEIKYDAPSVILDKLIKAEVGETSDEDLAKIQSGIVKELLELRDMIG